MTERFAELFEESLAEQHLRAGGIVKAKITAIERDYVILNAGLKSEGVVPISEFRDSSGKVPELEVGQEVEVVLGDIDIVEEGRTELSREKYNRHRAWRDLEQAQNSNVTVEGLIVDKVKGGFTVEVGSIRAFLPGSLIGNRPARDTAHLVGKRMEFKVIKMDEKRNNIVVSHKAVLQEQNTADRESLLANIEEGMEITGIVKNLTDYGAFIDLGGIDGLLHITDISWKRVKHPSQVLKVGEEVKVIVLKFDKERSRVSLGMKQLGGDPWQDIERRYPASTRIYGKVTNITDYGCFVEIEDGVEGLVHMSEMDWTNKNIHPSKIVSLGDEVEVMVLEIDEGRRRISLGIKQCLGNPWIDFSATHKKGDKITGQIRSITDFGLFIGLEGNIDGLVHLSDISWDLPGEEAVRNYKKGQEVEAVILAIDPERERISLGIKQLSGDPFGEFVLQNGKGSIVKGVVKSVDAKAATLQFAHEVLGTLKATEVNREKNQELADVLKEGDEIEVKIISIDKKARSVSVSIKAKDTHEEAEAMKQFKQQASQASNTTNLGELLKEKMDLDSPANPEEQ